MVSTAAAASSLFASLDKDGDGKVSAADLRGCMAAALGDDEKAAAFLASVDADGDGLLDRDDFHSLLGIRHEHEEEDSSSRYRCLREAFRMYSEEAHDDDRDEQQRITPASLQRMLRRLLVGSSSQQHPELELEECRAMICRFDLNGDGVLSFDEFRVMMHDGLLII